MLAVCRQTGAYAQILWRIVAHDFPQFIVVFAVILIAFSGSFVLALRGEDSLSVHPETRYVGHQVNVDYSVTVFLVAMEELLLAPREEE